MTARAPPAQPHEISGYIHRKPAQHHSYLSGAILEILASASVTRPIRTVFDLGCGMGGITHILAEAGYSVAGVDPSLDGIAKARERYPALRLELGSSHDDLRGRFGQWDAAIGVEVIEHVYDPRQYVDSLFSVLKPGGVAVISTPYHGYLKNLALALTGRMDHHFMAMRDHGHIKFWSIATLTELLTERGFTVVAMRRVGRVPVFAKSMIAVARKPG